VQIYNNHILATVCYTDIFPGNYELLSISKIDNYPLYFKIYFSSSLLLSNRKNKNFWEELLASFLLTRQGQHRKRNVNKSLYCCIRIRFSSNAVTDLLLSNDSGIHIQTQPDRSMLFRWLQVPYYRYQVLYRLVQSFKS
jgi:hypothetical protein